VKDAFLAAVLRGEEYLLQDGAMGTMLQAQGELAAGELPELLNLRRPQTIKSIHAAYVQAGAQMLITNTFGASAPKLAGKASVDEVFAAAIGLARGAGARYVGADIGPTGAMLAPLGSLSFQDAYGIFAEQVVAAQAHGADVIVLETMSDLLEMKAALLAAKENSNLPLFASMTFGEDGRTFLGVSPEAAAVTLGALGASVLGVNCSLGPSQLLPVVQALVAHAPCPVGVRPNAGLPREEAGQTVYDVGPAEYAQAMADIIAAGASVLGGCCGTDPSYIEALGSLVAGKRPAKPQDKSFFAISGPRDALVLHADTPALVVVGERLNPTGKKKMKEALLNRDFGYVVDEALAQQDAGADVLDVNVGLPELDEESVLVQAIEELQVVTGLPLQIDSSSPEAIEAAVRRYSGKPLVNSVNGTQESLQAILPLVKHYGCAVVGLTLDEEGIPATAEGRYAIAERIVGAAEALGIPREDVVIDCLVMAAATNQTEILEILSAVRMVKEGLGVRTTLGVSNVSFGLPQREVLNASFLAAACGMGLDLPIMNPLSPRYCEVVDSFKVLNAQDLGAGAYIERYAALSAASLPAPPIPPSALAGSGLPASALAGSDLPASALAGSDDLAKTTGIAGTAVLGGTTGFARQDDLSDATALDGVTALDGTGDLDGTGNLKGTGDLEGTTELVRTGASDGRTGLTGTTAVSKTGKNAALEGRGNASLGEQAAPSNEEGLEEVKQLIIAGKKAQMESAVKGLLQAFAPLDVINGAFIPALDFVGEEYERGRFFLPQMMASAEAVKMGFTTLRGHGSPALGSSPDSARNGRTTTPDAARSGAPTADAAPSGAPTADAGPSGAPTSEAGITPDDRIPNTDSSDSITPDGGIPRADASGVAMSDAMSDAVPDAMPDAIQARKICLATVKGDIHDIGKNIVAMLLENYGFEVIDLGRDVDPGLILATVREQGIRLVGLSALMTTTVRSMEQTIALLHAEAPDCKVFVGGAVLNPEYAQKIGADYYAKDAAAAARLASAFFNS
jgi:5-methyltetrahydrofolate--homocysteine methyltransferase